MNNFLLAFSFLFCQTVFAQIPSGTDIFLADCNFQKGQSKLETPINITSRQGYDNQPCFSPDGKTIYFVAIKEDKQADIYAYSTLTNTLSQITQTQESEYSPRPIDNDFLSNVRVESDSSQRLKLFSLSDNSVSAICPDLDSIGYYNWIDAHNFVFFKITNPSSLWLMDNKNCKEKLIATNIGRSIHPKSNSEIYFTQFVDSTSWICSLDLNTLKIDKIVACLHGSEDFAVITNTNFIQGNKSKLFNFNPKKSTTWIEIADFKANGVSAIKRISINQQKSKIAFVNDASNP